MATTNNKTEKKISVVIPALNEEKGIEQTIKGVPENKLKEMLLLAHLIYGKNAFQEYILLTIEDITDNRN